MINPLNQLKSIQSMINPAEIKQANMNQQKQIRIQVEEILKQTVILNAWAKCAERQAIALEKIVELLNKRI